MATRPGEPGRPALAALALLAAVACGGGTPRDPGADPSPAVSASTTAPGATTPPTPSPSGRPYVVGVLGDWGVDTPAVRRVVAAMTRFNGRRPLDAVLTTGDNAYDRGTEAESRRAHGFLAPLRSQRVPVHPALGNHDVASDGGRSFMRVFGMTRRWYTVTVGPVEFVVLDSTRVSDAGQLAFLDGVLGRPRPAAFRVVLFHHPGWSCSAHAPEPNVVRRWLPRFGTDVDLVLAGHNHTYERFRSPSGVPYVTTGGGGARLYASARPACRGVGKAQYLKTTHHAVRLTATRTALRLEAVGVDGKTFDDLSLSPR